MKLAVNQESADLLRELADRMPCEMRRIEEATENLESVYARVAGNVGDCEPQFGRLLRDLCEILGQMREPAMRMSDPLREVADWMEWYSRTHPGSEIYLGD